MIIGEAPGQEEDVQGKPFVGRSGRLMDQLFQEAGFNTNQHGLVANIAKCRPPGNRAPTTKEAQTCIPFLREQIRWVKPHFILLMGATALKHILIEKAKIPMKDLEGKFFQNPEYPDIKFMVLFHPAYILRDPRKKPLMLDHMNIFVQKWKSMS